MRFRRRQTRLADVPIDLSADVGEGFNDAALLPLLTSVNVSCGAHSGDWPAIRDTLRQAGACGLAIGAHPSFPDRENFGRRVTTRDPEQIRTFVVEQVNRLAHEADQLGLRLSHVKPHGALYDLCLWDEELSSVVVSTIAELNAFVKPGGRTDSIPLALVAPFGSPALIEACRAGLPYLAEAFVDRAYQADGRLVPRTEPGALLREPSEVTTRVLALARGEPITTIDGATLRLPADTLCLHGDTQGAAGLARAIRDALSAAGLTFKSNLLPGLDHLHVE